MHKLCVEYVWIDGFDTTRSKLRIIDLSDSQIEFEAMDDEENKEKKLKKINIPIWNFDGSSTGQAEGFDSDIILVPVKIYPNPFVTWCDSCIVLCECYNKNMEPHETNHRPKLTNTFKNCIDQEPLFGIEQEYVLVEKNCESTTVILPNGSYSKQLSNPKLYKWMKADEPGRGNQGPYYCGAGGSVSFGREISLKHLELCMKMGLKICGTNAEVLPSQWEYQLGPLNPLDISDQLWISRYVLQRVTEDYGCDVTFHPKPKKGNWNGTGAHTNFSTKKMRDPDGIEYIIEACKKLESTHKDHIKVYGNFNEERLSGNHETSALSEFSWGISNRGKSIRIPINVAVEKCGYLEDRRPGGNANPYLVTEIMLRSICFDKIESPKYTENLEEVD